MANRNKIIPFIKSAEGGWSNNSLDKGGETNKGITYSVWIKHFGADAHDRFMAMSNEDWGIIFYNEYWNKILGDKINSQRIANMIVDWVWNCGTYFPEKDIQIILVEIFEKHIVEDGVFGQATIDAINQSDEAMEYQHIIDRRLEYYQQIVDATPSQSIFLKGWQTRVFNLQKFELDNQ